MLNETILEGLVTGKIWRYDGDLFFRLACYRDPGRPAKPAPDIASGTQAPDYVTVRVPGGMIGGAPVSVERGQRLRVHGWLASRDERMSLQDFLRQAEGDKPEVEEETLGLSVPTYRLDLIPERIIILDTPEH